MMDIYIYAYTQNSVKVIDKTKHNALRVSWNDIYLLLGFDDETPIKQFVNGNKLKCTEEAFILSYESVDYKKDKVKFPMAIYKKGVS